MSTSKYMSILCATLLGLGTAAHAQLAPQSEVCTPEENSPEVWKKFWPGMSAQITNESAPSANNPQLFCSDDGTVSAKLGPGPLVPIGSLKGYYTNSWVPSKKAGSDKGHYSTNVLVEVTLSAPFSPTGAPFTYPTNYVINNYINNEKPCRVDVSKNGGVLQYNKSFVFPPNIDGDINFVTPGGLIYNIDNFIYGPTVNGLVNTIAFFNIQNFGITPPVGQLPFPNLQEIYYKRVPAASCPAFQQYKSIFPVTTS